LLQYQPIVTINLNQVNSRLCREMCDSVVTITCIVSRDEHAVKEISLQRHEYGILSNGTQIAYDVARKSKIIRKGAGFMKRVFVMISMVIFFGMLLLPGRAGAFDPEQLKQLKSQKVCKKCDLSGADLSGANLRGADLSGTNLTGTNLSEAKLFGADLRGADLSRASLLKADMTGANLTGANLSGAIWYNGGICKEGSSGECK
jgi:hypothetical protein